MKICILSALCKVTAGPSDCVFSIKMADADQVVGSRVSCEGYRGTVRYFGLVPPTEGEWYGIEWDDEARGKHNGTHDGVQYFHCRHANGGSFVRPKKVDFGVTVVQALYQRYGKNSDQHNLDQLYVVGDHCKKTMVGEESLLEKQNQFEKLKEVVLRNLSVCGPDKAVELHRVAPNITELDLSQNLLSSWQDVAEITAHLQHLRLLDLSESFLEQPNDPMTLLPSFSTISVLFLDKSALTWDQVVIIVNMMPSLQELHVRNNCIQDLRTCERISDHKLKGLQKIEMLNLEGNKLSNWEEGLGYLPRLQRLILNETGLPDIRIKAKAIDEHQPFVVLKSISLSRNNITEAASINQLNFLPALIELTFKDNPFCEDQSHCREQLIARIGSLKKLNRSPIGVRERRDAERDYLKKYSKAWVRAGGSSGDLKQEFLEEHPRYLELVREHGPPPDDCQKVTRTLKDSLISVNVKCPDAPEKKQITKKLPETMTIGKLKGLFYRLYKVDSADQKLSYVDSKIGREIELDDDLRQLSFYSVESGDTILVRW